VRTSSASAATVRVAVPTDFLPDDFTHNGLVKAPLGNELPALTMDLLQQYFSRRVDEADPTEGPASLPSTLRVTLRRFLTVVILNIRTTPLEPNGCTNATNGFRN
jgi:hypothetical protein